MTHELTSKYDSRLWIFVIVADEIVQSVVDLVSVSHIQTSSSPGLSH
jgi:hypothetical protein